jgi:hypothetical protein
MSHYFGCARAYAMLTRVVFFPYAEQIEETITWSPYADLRKWGFCLRQALYDKAGTKIVRTAQLAFYLALGSARKGAQRANAPNKSGREEQRKVANSLQGSDT